jgi:outer membrane protein insertion porin family
MLSISIPQTLCFVTQKRKLGAAMEKRLSKKMLAFYGLFFVVSSSCLLNGQQDIFLPESEFDTPLANDDGADDKLRELTALINNQDQSIEDHDNNDESQVNSEEKTAEEQVVVPTNKRINQIIITGNKHVPTEAIASRVPYKVGEIFIPAKTSSLIRNIYNDLRRFRNITVMGEDLNNDKINLHIIVEEKNILKDVVFKGNTQVTAEEIKKKIDFTKIPAVDKEELKKYAQIIKKLYVDKGYHLVTIDTDLEVDADGKAVAVFTVTEPKKSVIHRVKFIGNKHISDKILRRTVLSKEDWILGFLDQSGTYHPERLEADRHFIEQIYQNSGFMNAKVADIKVDLDPETNHIDLTFEIEEGDQYTIKEVKAPGNELLTEEQLLSYLSVYPGQIFSRDAITNSIKTLERIWNNHGYLFVNIEPSMVPDDETKTVNVAFYSDLGQKVKLNRLAIKGNRKTKDKVIRRQINLTEGEILTDCFMEDAKNRVQSLGYFEQRDGVNWKVTRLTEDLADLDLIVQEAKTGRAFMKIGVGGTADMRSPLAGFAAELDVADINLFGSGIQFNLAGRLGKDERSLIFSLGNPWLFDKPIRGKMDLYYKKLSYEDLHNTRPVNERDRGGILSLGYMPRFRYAPFLNGSLAEAAWGINSIDYGRRPSADVSTAARDQHLPVNAAYQFILDKEFLPGTYSFLTLGMQQDFRNHPMHPTRGHSWHARGQLALPVLSSHLGFGKFDFDFHWYTPLINDYDLIFHLRAYAGIVSEWRNNNIPYPELFHIGGPASVRGFLFGQVGPQFVSGVNSDSIGGRKAFFWNAELIVPISPDFSMKGVFFYDGGTGWDNPYVQDICNQFLGENTTRNIRNNCFDYRHSVGVGIRIMNPMPIKIDWGFKLEPRPGETPYEVHFGMAYEW